MPLRCVALLTARRDERVPPLRAGSGLAAVASMVASSAGSAHATWSRGYPR